MTESFEERCLAKATEVNAADYDGPVFVEGLGATGYFSDMDELLEYLHDEGDDRPEWAFVALVTYVTVDADHAIEYATQEHHEDIYDYIPHDAVDELKKACEKFNAAVKDAGGRSWDWDTRRKVRIPAR